jgi:YidC/Oxa1 family membrane protein insertase
MPEYRSPQNEPGMERNLLLVFVLMAVAVFGSQYLMKKYAPQSKSTAQPTQPIQSGAPSNPPAVQSEPAAAPAAAVVKSGKTSKAASPGLASKQAASESEIVVENDLYRITFTNRGGQVKSWVLKKFSDDRGQPLDLVNRTNAVKYGYPLSLWTYDQTQRDKLNSALYVPSTTAPTLTAPGDLTFDYSDSGLTVRKTFHFDKSYAVGVDTSVFANDSPLWAFPAWPVGFGDQSNVPAYASSQFEFQVNSNIEDMAAKKIAGGATLTGNYNWAGISDQYFAAVFIPDRPEDVRVVTMRNSVDAAASPTSSEIKPADALGLAVGRPGGSTQRLFVGPKSLEVLEAVSVPTIVGAEKNLHGVVNFGSLGLIARPLFAWPVIGLRWIHEHTVHNWGWAIVLQTFMITIALLPLRIFQMKSALKMQRVQPQMKAIQEKYKKYSMSDPRKQDMQKEIGELYKREGVNPIGGCLPLLVQLPFLWAYYKMLGAAIDLRQAHWLWIHDLSARDPIFLLPAVMVISMFLIQRITPQAGMDPAQQRMMNIMMPAMMGFIFFNLPAGLNLYYAESNLISIAQQWIMNKTELGREMRAIAAKRARKKDK